MKHLSVLWVLNIPGSGKTERKKEESLKIMTNFSTSFISTLLVFFFVSCSLHIWMNTFKQFELENEMK